MGGRKKGFKWSKKQKINFKNAQLSYTHWNYNNGRIGDKGYIRIFMPNHPNADKKGYILEHRYCTEAYLGRFLERKESIHHIDEKRDNNIPDNLYLFSSETEHQRYHRLFEINKVELIVESNLL